MLSAKEGVLEDATGRRLAVSKGESTGFGKSTVRVLRPHGLWWGQPEAESASDKPDVKLYNFIKIETAQTMSGSAGSMGLYTSDEEAPAMYTGKRLQGFGQKFLVSKVREGTEEEQFVCKMWQSDFFGTEYTAEISSGVDPVSLMTFCQFLAGGGSASSAIGGMAGAGVI